ncbi:MAG: M23 family metallopeptidase [Desulfobacteraceae bacterium]|nr:MAG: M23 family metallopeptidase [Desulfobacteraceae bacterium]
MRKRIKIWFHSGSTSAIRELSIHRAVFAFCLVLCMAVLSGIGYVGYDYYRLKTISFDNARLNSQIQSRDGEIHSQRNQIQTFAREIEVLKSEVRKLSEFEDKVRLIADIRKTDDTGGLIGIGGIPTTELDEEMPREVKHNGLIREMHQQMGQMSLVTENQAKDFEDLIQILEEKKNLLASTPSIRPVSGYVTSKFGYRISPFTGQKEFHSGIDISNRSGTKIVATAKGKVTYASRKRLIGNLITIDHGFGRVTKYGHCKKILVKKGQKVKRGDVIATVGKSGRTTGPHLHYEVRINGAPENPLKYILN